MHIIDIWLEELKIFAPSNLKSLFWGIGKQLRDTFRFLCIECWWIFLPFLFSHLIFYALLHVVESGNAIQILQVLLVCFKGYYAFLAALVTFPGARGRVSQHYVTGHQSLVWPVVTPFALLIYVAPHAYKLFSLLFSRTVVLVAVKYLSLVFLVQIDWFTSPFFIFFAFLIMSSYVRDGVRHTLGHTMHMIWYTYPVCVLVFGFLYGLNWALDYCMLTIGDSIPLLELAINPMAILIPIAVGLYGAVYEWHMKLVDE